MAKKLEKSKRWHGEIPASVLLDGGLDPLAKVVYGILSLEVWGVTSYVGQRLLASVLGVSQQTIMRRLESLEKRGHIQIDRKSKGKRSYYSMTSPVFTERPEKKTTSTAKPKKQSQASIAAMAHKLTRTA